jgi:hypothetical protein
MAYGSVYGKNIYGKGLYSAVRHRDVSSAVGVVVDLSESILSRVQPVSVSFNIAVNLSADLWTAHQELFSAALEIDMSIIAVVQRNVGYKVSMSFVIDVAANPYLGPFWIDKECNNGAWSNVDCAPKVWETVNSTPDPWSKVNG